MWGNHPTIELAGFERLRDVERQIYYSPIAWIMVLIGMGGAAYVLWSMRNGIELFPRGFFVGYGILLASYGGLLAYVYGYRLRRLKCPGCEERMLPFVADMGEGSWRWFISSFEINGRHYRKPIDEDDRREWVRIAMSVVACPSCRTFVDCSHLRFETCTEEELEQIRLRMAKRSVG